MDAEEVAVNLRHFDGWHLIGAFPDNEPDDVGSWLLVHGGEALLLELPEGLRVKHVKSALKEIGAKLLFATASHDHEDHLDADAWGALGKAFPDAQFIHPASVKGDLLLHVSGEPLWLVGAPKHSACDVVTVFRGVAMTGDIELGMLASVNNEVPWPTRVRSMNWLRGFPHRAGYHAHSIVSAHLNDVRVSIRWPDLFRCPEVTPTPGRRAQCRRYGCWGRLVAMEPDPARLGSGFDMICEDCGCPDWSDPRRK
jgi:hypothetical protein